MTDKPVFYWHIHHDVLVGPLTKTIENRIAFIKEQKLEHERETRLRLMRPVKGRLPDAVVEAWYAYLKAGNAYDKLSAAWRTYDKALADHKDKIEALHAKECPNCPWNGETIFPENTP